MRDIVQDSVDDRTLRRLCADDYPALYNNYGGVPFGYSGRLSTGSLSRAATQFRRLAAGYDNIPAGSDLDYRTSALLHSRSLW